MRIEKRLRWRIGFLRAVAAQVRTGRPPEVRGTYNRLRAAGLPAWRAYRLLAAAYEAEVAAMLLGERVYDRDSYVRQLELLPGLPALSLGHIELSKDGRFRP